MLVLSAGEAGVDRGVLWVATTLTALALVVGLAWGARRLLGLPVGTRRTLAAGLLGMVVSWAVGGNIQRHNPGVFMTVTLGVALLASMTFIVVIEALVPSGSWPGTVEFVRGLRRRAARGRRYSQISRIAARHGLGPYLRGRRRADPDGRRAVLARSLQQALQEGGVTFVKLGQVLSTRRDLLPVEFVDALALLQHRVAPAPWAEVEAVLAAELGAPVSDVFAEFDPEPLAAASIAQVHRARLRSGGEVVVKIQRPGIGPIVERDLDILARLAASLDRRTTWGHTLGLVELADGFAVALREELDFRIEARNTAAVLAAGSGRRDPNLILPRPHPELSTARVLVLDLLDGIPLGIAVRTLDERGVDRGGLARTLLGELLRQIMFDGVFHADPHPGNIMLLTDGRLALLDFGSVGRIDAQLRGGLQDLLLALGRADPAAMSDALLRVVTRPAELDEQRLQRALGQFMARHLSAGLAPDMAMFTDLFRLVSAFELTVAPEIAAVFRALATVEGTLTGIEPGFDIFAEARGYATAHVTEQFEPGSLRDAATSELLHLLPVLRRLPRRFERLTGALEEGRLGVNVRLLADERDRRVVTSMLHRTLLTVLGATAGIMAVLLLGTEGGPRVGESVGLYQVFGYNLLVVSCVLVLRVLFTIFRAERVETRR
ncbi:ABC1 kinase family protein [Embleya sp. NPDC055664]